MTTAINWKLRLKERNLNYGLERLLFRSRKPNLFDRLYDFQEAQKDFFGVVQPHAVLTKKLRCGKCNDEVFCVNGGLVCRKCSANSSVDNMPKISIEELELKVVSKIRQILNSPVFVYKLYTEYKKYYINSEVAFSDMTRYLDNICKKIPDLLIFSFVEEIILQKDQVLIKFFSSPKTTHEVALLA